MHTNTRAPHNELERASGRRLHLSPPLSQQLPIRWVLTGGALACLREHHCHRGLIQQKRVPPRSADYDGWLMAFSLPQELFDVTAPPDSPELIVLGRPAMRDHQPVRLDARRHLECHPCQLHRMYVRPSDSMRAALQISTC